MIAAIAFLSICAVLVLVVIWATSTNNQPAKYQHAPDQPRPEYRPL